MPLTAQGKRTLEDFTKRYGPKKGKSIFYAKINSGKLKRSQYQKYQKILRKLADDTRLWSKSCSD